MVQFKIEGVELEKLREWFENRPKMYSGVSGGRYTYRFTPTGLGTIVTVTDGCTDEKIDVTDYDSW